MTIDLKLTPQRSALLDGHANEIHVLVRAQAPDAPAADSGKERSKMNLALVIDRSGSMSGRPLDEAKRCAHMIVDALRADDTISVIAYDNAVQLVPNAVASHPAIVAQPRTAHHWADGAALTGRL